jgi:hypothetical protein
MNASKCRFVFFLLVILVAGGIPGISNFLQFGLFPGLQRAHICSRRSVTHIIIRIHFLFIISQVFSAMFQHISALNFFFAVTSECLQLAELPLVFFPGNALRKCLNLLIATFHRAQTLTG